MDDRSGSGERPVVRMEIPAGQGVEAGNENSRVNYVSQECIDHRSARGCRVKGHLVGSDTSGEGARWRIYISHTSELREFPKGNSYVTAVERAISAAGHVIVDMKDFPAASQSPAQLCAERVRGCDVYVGVLGTRYGSLVPDRPQMSYTELEFDTASEAGLPRLVFILDTTAENVGIPVWMLIDAEFGGRQAAFRRRVQDSRLVTQPFSDPAALGQLVERSLRDLADNILGIENGPGKDLLRDFVANIPRLESPVIRVSTDKEIIEIFDVTIARYWTVKYLHRRTDWPGATDGK